MNARRLLNCVVRLGKKVIAWVGRLVKVPWDKHVDLMERPGYRSAVKEGLTTIQVLLNLHPITRALLVMAIAAHVAAFHHEASRPMVHDSDPEPMAWPRFEPRERGFAW